MSAHTGRLLLSTQDPYLLPERPRLIAVLSAAGFLGARLADRDNAYAVGERFLQLVTFAGCSVRIELSPGGDSPFCHVRLAGPFERPRLVSGRNTRPPRCRSCRSPLKGWREYLAQWSNGNHIEIPCPACGASSPPWAYDWKEKAGFGRLLVQVEEVFPGEATPTTGLMELLEHAAGGPWQHFYIQDG